jgi:hypothetical protein
MRAGDSSFIDTAKIHRDPDLVTITVLQITENTANKGLDANLQIAI